MKCPNCNLEGMRYLKPRKKVVGSKYKLAPRTNFQAKCNSCGLEAKVQEK